jgi:hypothetical protein
MNALAKSHGSCRGPRGSDMHTQTKQNMHGCKCGCKGRERCRRRCHQHGTLMAQGTDAVSTSMEGHQYDCETLWPLLMRP